MYASTYCSLVITQTTFESNTLSTAYGYIITSESNVLMGECIIRKNSVPTVTFFPRATVTVSNSLIEDGVIFGGNLRVINSYVINSQLQLVGFESQNSTIASSSIWNVGKTVINTSQLIDSHNDWLGGIVSNTTIRNSSIVIGFGRMTFSNSQLFPTKVTNSCGSRIYANSCNSERLFGVKDRTSSISRNKHMCYA